MSFLVGLGRLTTPSSPLQGEASPVSLERAHGVLWKAPLPSQLAQSSSRRKALRCPNACLLSTPARVLCGAGTEIPSGERTAVTNLQAAVAPPSSSETEGRIPEHSPLRLVAGTATVSPLQIGKLNQEGQEES